jgi:CheY-like chemotaxis protein
MIHLHPRASRFCAALIQLASCIVAQDAKEGHRMRLLLAEDERAVRFVMAEALRDAGFQIMAATDGQRALDLLISLKGIDVLVTDYNMPGADGVEVAQLARSLHPEMPVVFVTGRPDLLAERPIHPPCFYLTKPFSMAQLVATVRQAAKQ